MYINVSCFQRFAFLQERVIQRYFFHLIFLHCFSLFTNFSLILLLFFFLDFHSNSILYALGLGVVKSYKNSEQFTLILFFIYFVSDTYLPTCSVQSTELVYIL
uniref:(northern house mosquito) hypothetical protein n=1 Tax=Culex pipiens TaxID=7175 RepID=A0A8D8NVJ0_CULPI